LTLTKELEKNDQSGNEIILFEYMERCSIRISFGKTIQLNLFLNYVPQKQLQKAIVIIKIRHF